MSFRDYIDILNLTSDEELYNTQNGITRIYNQRDIFARGDNLPTLFDRVIREVSYHNQLSLTQIADSLGISDTQLRRLRNGTRPIPLRILRKICGSNNNAKKTFENAIDCVSSSAGKTIRIPQQITPLLVEILGRFSGDGASGSYEGGEYRWRLREGGKQFVYQQIADMQQVFGIIGTYKDEGNHALFEINSKPLVRLFQQLFEYNENFNKSLYGIPPQLLYHLNWDLRRYYTTGIIDTEGSFYYTNQAYYFEIHMANSHFVLEACRAFDYVGIPYDYHIRNNGTYRLRVYNQNNMPIIRDSFEIKNEKRLTTIRNWELRDNFY